MARPRFRLATAAGALLALAGAAGASAPSRGPQPTSARALAIRIVLPGTAAAGTESVSAPPDSVAFGAGFDYGVAGATVSSGAVTASALVSSGETASAQASSDVSALSLFGGEITAARVSARAKAAAGPRAVSAGTAGSSVSRLVVLGQPVSPVAGDEIELADWGTATLLRAATAAGVGGGSKPSSAAITVLDISLTAPHGDLPSGAHILVGSAEAAARSVAPAPTTSTAAPPAQPPPPPPPAAPPPPAPPPPAAPEAPTPHVRRERGHDGASGAQRRVRRAQPPARRGTRRQAPFSSHGPLLVTPPLGAGDRVFPVFGPASFSDTYGAARADVSWHHGDDIFAPLGTPVLAAGDGTVFSVGWIPIGGNRLWLRDRHGNQFYYAHLSAYSPLGVNGARVSAGDVLGFVGNTGDARTTPYHLHFEIHPRSLLGLGYDGAVNPTAYLAGWRHVQTLSVFAAAFTGPAVATGDLPEGSAVPEPGAILLHVSDISSASGLDPGSLRSALSSRVTYTSLGSEGPRGSRRTARPAAVPLRRG